MAWAAAHRPGGVPVMATFTQTTDYIQSASFGFPGGFDTLRIAPGVIVEATGSNQPAIGTIANNCSAQFWCGLFAIELRNRFRRKQLQHNQWLQCGLTWDYRCVLQ